MRPRRAKIPAGTQRARSRGGAYPEPRIEGAGATRAEETMRKIKSIDLEHHFLGGREPRDISRVLRQKNEHLFGYPSVTSPTLSVRLFELSTASRLACHASRLACHASPVTVRASPVTVRASPLGSQLSRLSPLARDRLAPVRASRLASRARSPVRASKKIIYRRKPL